MDATDLDTIPLWERLPPRALDSEELAAALPETTPADAMRVYADVGTVFDGETEFETVVVEGGRFHRIDLVPEQSDDGGGYELVDGGEWRKIDSAPSDVILNDGFLPALYEGDDETEIGPSSNFRPIAEWDADEGGRQYLVYADVTVEDSPNWVPLGVDDARSLRSALAFETAEQQNAVPDGLDDEAFAEFAEAVAEARDASAEIGDAFGESIASAIEEVVKSVADSDLAAAASALDEAGPPSPDEMPSGVGNMRPSFTTELDHSVGFDADDLIGFSVPGVDGEPAEIQAGGAGGDAEGEYCVSEHHLGQNMSVFSDRDESVTCTVEGRVPCGPKNVGLVDHPNVEVEAEPGEVFRTMGDTEPKVADTIIQFDGPLTAVGEALAANFESVNETRSGEETAVERAFSEARDDCRGAAVRELDGMVDENDREIRVVDDLPTFGEPVGESGPMPDEATFESETFEVGSGEAIEALAEGERRKYSANER